MRCVLCLQTFFTRSSVSTFDRVPFQLTGEHFLWNDPQRLDVLLHVKWTVKEFDCNLTREIVELIDREADLIDRGRDVKTMGGLRRRL